MATVKLLQPTNMVGLLEDFLDGGGYYGTTEFGGYNAAVTSWYAASGTFSSVTEEGVISQVLIDDLDYGLAPNLEISGLSFALTETYWAEKLDFSGQVDEFVKDLLAGNDTITGSSGVDTMQGLAGDDTYRVNNDGDVVLETAAANTDTVIVIVSLNYTLTVGSDVEVLRTTGSSSTYTANLRGNELANTIVGNGGVNIINGRGGTDILTGFGGSDIFRFDTTLGASNVDTITDFNVVADTIQLQNSIFTTLTTTGTLAAGAFRIGAAAGDSSDRIVYNSANGELIYDTNGSTAGGATHFATLKPGLALTNADFVVI